MTVHNNRSYGQACKQETTRKPVYRKMVGNSRRAILSFRPFGGKYYMLVSSEQTFTRKSLFVCVAIVNKFISLSLLRRLVRFDMSTLIRT